MAKYILLVVGFLVILFEKLIKIKKKEGPTSKQLTWLGMVWLIFLPLILFIIGMIRTIQDDNQAASDKLLANQKRIEDSNLLARRWLFDTVKFKQIIDSSNTIIKNSSYNLLKTEKNLQNSSSLLKRQDLQYFMIDKLDQKTDDEFAVSGDFHFPINQSLSKGTMIVSYAGDRVLGTYNYDELNPKIRSGFIKRNNLEITSTSKEFFINAKVSNLEGDVIVEIVDNKWRINKNEVSKFNYDSTGFEIFDNKGRIVISFDFRKEGNSPNGPFAILLQGIIPMSSNSVVLFVKDRYKEFKYGTSDLNQLVYKDYDSIPIKPIFQYFGPKWRHMRVR